jgi:hypothetical protein
VSENAAAAGTSVPIRPSQQQGNSYAATAFNNEHEGTATVTAASRKSYNLAAVLAIGAGAAVLIPSLLACAGSLFGVALAIF